MNEKIATSIADLIKTRSVLTLLVFGTICVLALTGKQIPDLLALGGKVLMGVWFGEKAWTYIRNGKGGITNG